MLIFLAVAHQGEEFVLILPAILLVGALFVLRWANAPAPESEEASEQDAVEVPVESGPVAELQSVGGGERLVR